MMQFLKKKVPLKFVRFLITSSWLRWCKYITKMSYVYKLSEDVAPSLRGIFEEREWIEWNPKVHEQNEWNILWTTKRFFTASSSYSLSAFQKLNHFKRTSQMTKKDNLTRNLKRMRANFGKIYSFYPKTYQFPLQYSEFVTMIRKKNHVSNHNSISLPSSIEHFLNDKRNSLTKKSNKRRNSDNQIPLFTEDNYYNSINTSIWIAKPASGRRGENITLFTDVSKLNYTQPMIVQKYISNPLLVGGYKFDLRIYVLITSFRPLKIYCYNEGLCRFSTQQYDIKDLNNIYSHLTNSSINKSSDTFKQNKLVIGSGCKWTIDKLLKHLQIEIDNDHNLKSMDNNHNEKKINIRNKIWGHIHDIIILTVLPIIMDVEQCPNCFELFGFDVLIDDKYNCWLLEVNGSPAIAIQSDVDKQVKYPMLNDLIDCVESQFGFIIPNKKYNKKRRSSLSSSSSTKSSKGVSRNSSMIINKKSNASNVDITHRLDNMDLSGCKNDQCSEEVKDDDEDDLFKNEIGGFEQIFPFNANTFESNKVLTNMSDSMMSRAQKFKTIVVKEIKKRRRNRNKSNQTNVKS